MGVLDLFDPADRQLPTLELVKSLEVFATHAAVAIENARQYEALEEATGQLQAQLALRHAILELSGALLATLEPGEVFARIATLLKEIVDYDSLEVRLVDEEKQELYSGYYSDDADGEQMRSWRGPVDVGVSGWVLQNNQAQLVNDMLNDPRGALVPGTEWEPQASIIAPLTLGDTPIGVLALDRLGERTFDQSELESVTLFANLAAIAIHNARQYEEAEKASRQLEEQLALRHELLSASGAVLSSLEQTEVLEHIADTLKQIVDYDTMDVRLVDAARRQLVAIYARDETRRAGDLRLRHPSGRGHQRLGRAAQRGPADQRHGQGPARRPHPRHRRGRGAGLHPRTALRRRRGLRRHDDGPARRAHFRRSRARARAAVRQPRGDRHPQRPAVRRAGDDVRPARGPARPAARAHGPQHAAAQLARPARSLLAHHHHAQGHRRLRRHGHPHARRGDARAGVHLLARQERGGQRAVPALDRRGDGRVGRASRRGAAGQRHDARSARRAYPGHGGGRTAGQHRGPAASARKSDRRPHPGPLRGPHLRGRRPRAGQALRQPGGDRHPERADVRGDGAPGHQRRPHRHPQLPPLPRVAQGRGQPRRPLRRALLPADDGPRPLQGGQRHHRPPEGRRRAARGLGRAAQLLPRVGLPRPLRRRGVRDDPSADDAGRGRRRLPSASGPPSRCWTRAIPTCT